MNNDYSPSTLSVILLWIIAIAIPVAVAFLFFKFTEMPFWFCVWMGAWMGGMGSISYVISAYYPVFMSDRILICNAMIPSICKEYRLSEIEGVRLGWTRKLGDVFYISPKGGERWIAYQMILKKDQIERIRQILADFPNTPAKRSIKDNLLTPFNIPSMKCVFIWLAVGLPVGIIIMFLTLL